MTPRHGNYYKVSLHFIRKGSISNIGIDLQHPSLFPEKLWRTKRKTNRISDKF